MSTFVFVYIFYKYGKGEMKGNDLGKIGKECKRKRNNTDHESIFLSPLKEKEMNKSLFRFSSLCICFFNIGTRDISWPDGIRVPVHGQITCGGS